MLDPSYEFAAKILMQQLPQEERDACMKAIEAAEAAEPELRKRITALSIRLGGDDARLAAISEPHVVELERIAHLSGVLSHLAVAHSMPGRAGYLADTLVVGLLAPDDLALCVLKDATIRPMVAALLTVGLHVFASEMAKHARAAKDEEAARAQSN